MTNPATIMGTNKTAIKSHPFQYKKDPAGKKRRKPTNSNPDITFVIACTNNLPFI
jgi:hypothetical protein